MCVAPEKVGKISQRRKFEYAFKKKKKVEKDVIVCEAEADCVIQASKPIFIHEKDRPGHSIAGSMTYNLHSDAIDDDEEISCINVKDIKDMNLAMKLVDLPKYMDIL